MSHLIGLEAVKRYAEIVGLGTRVSDKMTPRQTEKALQNCGDTLALFVYRECASADALFSAAAYMSKAIDELRSLRDSLWEKHNAT